MRERGRYQIQCMKSRSSTGVGQKIDLEYNIETMRITDPGLDANDTGNGPPKVNSIMNQIKTSSTVKDSVDTSTGEIKTPGASVDSSKLKQMLAGLKKTE
jgi:hypothetical protein